MIRWLIIFCAFVSVSQTLQASFLDTLYSWFFPSTNREYESPFFEEIERTPNPQENASVVEATQSIPNQKKETYHPKFKYNQLKKPGHLEKFYTLQNSRVTQHVVKDEPVSFQLSDLNEVKEFSLSDSPENLVELSQMRLDQWLSHRHDYKKTIAKETTCINCSEEVTEKIKNEGHLILRDSHSQSLNHEIKGSGKVEKQGQGSLKFLAPCHVNALKISEGSVEARSEFLPQKIHNESKLLFSQEDETIYNGVISGSGEVYFEGGGCYTLKNKQLYSGKTFVCDAELILAGDIQDIEIQKGASLRGNGSVRHVFNKGRISPGNSIGNIQVNGNFVQTSSGLLEVEVSSRGESDQIFILGDAQLAGRLQIRPQNGSYRKGVLYTFLNANSIEGTFSDVLSDYPGLFSLIYNEQNLQLLTLFSAPVLPVSIASLVGNSKRMADYLYGNGFMATNSDLANALDQLASLSAPYFREGLIKVSPLIYGSLPRLNLQNDIRIANTLDHQFKQICSCIIERPKYYQRRWFRKLRGKKALKRRHLLECVADRKNALWAEPIGFYYQQEATGGAFTDEGQPGFDAYTYGVAVGYAHLFSLPWQLRCGVGYTHSNLFWNEDLGQGGLDTVYLSPSLSYQNNRLGLSALFQSSFNFYGIERRIHYGSLKREASGHHKYFDYLFRLNADYLFELGHDWTITPQAQLNYLLITGQSFDESGADSLDLRVNPVKVNYFQPNATFRLQKDFWWKKGRFYPSCYVGWLANIPVGQKDLQAKFVGEQTERTRVVITSYQYTSNQMIFGLNASFQSYRNLVLSAGYEATFLSRYQIQQLTLRVGWDF